MQAEIEKIIARIKQRIGNREINILIADDEEYIREMVVGTLNNCGFECFENSNGKDAVSTYRANPPHFFSIVLLDDRMRPLDGREALPQILEINPEARVVMFTTAVSEVDFKGAVALVHKPVRMFVLLNVIEDVLISSM
jgi:CheY-like chemotaxis protein